ncbi:hypothetical protein G9A89_007395 [Geosiphon pyriformis]|nr:hypothetical protein G9A89_007395 [Geosiphon pyriformis]
MNELAINTSESTRKKKNLKIDFVLDPNKVFKSIVNNNKPSKAKVFKNSSKLELSEIVQKSESYFVVKNLIEMPVYITFGQLITHFQFRKNLCKSLILKKKTPKTNKCLHQAGLVNNSNVTPFICKVQVAGYFINLILDNRSFVSIIAKHFLEAIGRKIDELSTRPMTNIHGDKKKGLGIAKAVPVQINGISIETDIKKAKALLDYELCELIIRYSKKPIMVKCYYWTTPLVLKQSQEEEQSDKSDDDESEEKDEQKETVELVYTIFTSNGKPLDNIKADKKKSCLARKQKTVIGNMVLMPNIEQRELFLEEKKVDIENLLAKNSPIISKEDDVLRCTYVIQHTITTRETCPIYLKPY